VTGDGVLQTLALPALTTITVSTSISNNSGGAAQPMSLTLTNLATVALDFTLSGNKIGNVDSLKNLASIGRTLTMNSNSSLTTIAGLTTPTATPPPAGGVMTVSANSSMRAGMPSALNPPPGGGLPGSPTCTATLACAPPKPSPGSPGSQSRGKTLTARF